MQRITVTCSQVYGDEDVVTSSGSIEGLDMSLDPWRQAITSAAAASGFHPDILHRMILEWAGDIESGAA